MAGLKGEPAIYHFLRRCASPGGSTGSTVGTGTCGAQKFRSVLVEDGEEGERDARKGRRGIPKAEAAAVRAKDGRMGFARMLRHRVSHFTEGMALGGEGFLESVFAMNSIK